MNSKSPYLSRCVFILASVVFATCQTERLYADELSAQGILDKSKEKMDSTLSYRMISEGIEMQIYQKKSTNNSLGVRMEASKPVEMVSISSGKEGYEIYPTYGVIIDKTFMHELVMEGVHNLSTKLGSKAAGKVTFKGYEKRDGKDYYIIESLYAQAARNEIEKTASDKVRSKLPIGERVLIDKESFFPAEMQTFANFEVKLTKIIYKDFKEQPVLSDELFLPPNGLEMKKPKSIEEYVNIMQEMITAGHKAQIKDEIERRNKIVENANTEFEKKYQALMEKSKKRQAENANLKVTIDPKTGRAIPATPPGMKKEEFDKVLAESVAKHKSERPNKIAGEPVSASRKTGIIFTLTVIVVLSILFVKKRLANR